MNSVLFVLQYQGIVTPDEDDFWKLTISTTATSQTAETSLTLQGVSAVWTAGKGETVRYESTMRVDDEGYFTEKGHSRSGRLGASKLRRSTVAA